MEEDYISSTDDDCYFSDQDLLDYELPSEEEEEDDDDDDSDQFSLQSGSRSSSNKVITKESLLAALVKPSSPYSFFSLQREDLRRVMEFLALTEQHARTLLIHHRWDIEKLFTVLVEKGKDLLFAEAGVIVVDRWTEHFTIKINEGQSRRIRCMAHGCSTICDEATIRNLVTAKNFDLAERFECFLLESYIEDNKKVKWCPSVPHCGNAIRVEDDEYCEVECLCGIQFCFRCSSEVHSPCSCLMWKLWTQKQEESETDNWITMNTMTCPKCHRAVEKNGGCNLMGCICGQTFCWLCGGATGRAHTWQNIKGHSCGHYKRGEKRAGHPKQTLDRYVHYQNFYKAHKVSFKFETKLKEGITNKMSILERKKSTLEDFSWVTNGHCRLLISRQVLTYSYPFAFYMFGDDLFKDEMTMEEKELKEHEFQVMQQRLQANVEKLSKVLEEPFHVYSEDRVMEIRIQVTNLSLIADRQCKKMYEFIENDLLGSLQMEIQNIAPYRSNGVERASEIPIWNSKKSLNGRRTSCNVRERRGQMQCRGGERTECHQLPSSGSLTVARRSVGRILKKMLVEMGFSNLNVSRR
ncbi:zinc finger protein [Macleaya cordata]|uniref:RBR-type E3 ubiquitin transferase n=1 Tax=Macleaya cordata TaxID=56857 RepID=A0A200Q409_MACCD|nr:zinc finger protein [Macleaya cordata]